MLLVYTPKLTHRLAYILKFILKEICLYDFNVSHSQEEFLNFKGAKINYSEFPISEEEFFIKASPLLMEKGIKDFTPAIDVSHPKFPLIFPQPPNSACDMGFDIFAAAFYMLSRYEEHLSHIEDRHGRFEADQSFAYMHNFLDRPIIDEYALELQKKLIQKYPFIIFKSKKFKFIPTYDIDFAYAFKGKGVLRNFLVFIADIIHLRFKTLHKRIRVLLRLERDPFDTYSYQLRLQKRYKLNPIYFFLTAAYSYYDKGISVHSKCYQLLVKTLNDYAHTGIHPSYRSNHNPEAFSQEIETLSKLLNKPIEYSRQHFLKLKLPDTYLELLKHNIYSDFTMGFASHVGFRAGTCTPFYFYNLNQERETELKVFPLAIMDASLKNYMNLEKEEALEVCKKIIDRVKQVKGTLITLWHNDALCECQYWKGWKSLYEDLIVYTLKNGAITDD